MSMTERSRIPARLGHPSKSLEAQPALRRRPALRDWAAYAERLTPERIKRFWSHVTIAGPGECWLWHGAQSGTGYGRFALFAKGRLPAAAHRVSVMKGRSWQHRKTHCRHGHAFTPDNTKLCPRKGRGLYRRCATCDKSRYQLKRNAA